jgi:hypothetical protein
MSKFSKFKEILAIGSAVAKPFVPGQVGSVLDAVNGHLHKGGIAGPLPDALKKIAADNDEQTEAILALHARLKAVETKLGL